MINWIRSFKWIIQLYNLFKRKELLHNVPLYKKYGIKKKYYSCVSSEDFKHLDNPKPHLDRLDSAQELPKMEAFNALDKKIQSALLPWSENGYAILENFFSEDEVERYNAEIQHLLDTNQVIWSYAQKIMFAIRQSKTLFESATNPQLMRILEMLVGKKMSIFQSINFLKGSQQKAHSDFVHMTTFPQNNIIAVWVALEDITADSGPIHYYPSSHRLPLVLNANFDNIGTAFRNGKKDYCDYEDKIEQIIAEKQLKKEIFLPKKGDVLIWHANLIHGGEPIQNPKSSRKSMVFHYYANDAICFHEISERPALRPVFSH
jgi:ectoine hydroxylase-related dioxygenase (phytanoyl-CoA dioxygenase family)